jgi:plasmid stabilization system protein ParE
VKDLLVLSSAERDINEAYAWYEGRDPGLGEDYLRSLDACLLSVRTTPEAFRNVVRDYRRAVLRRFPYAVYYKDTQDSVVVYAVLHSAQDPSKWRRRLP